jgi:hypothetical protein
VGNTGSVEAGQKVDAGSRSKPDEELQPVLFLMRLESWFIGQTDWLAVGYHTLDVVTLI